MEMCNRYVNIADMKQYKNYLLAGIGAVLLMLLVGVYFFFQSPFTAWNLVPNNAMAILETTHLPHAYQDLQKKKIWKNLKNAPYFQVLQQRFEGFLKIVEQASHKHNFWENKRVTLSLHWVGKEDFDALFFVPITQEKDAQIYREAINLFAQKNKAKFTQRSLSGENITEIVIEETEERFAFLVYKGYWVGSFSPLLLEDVLRKIKAGESAYSFAQASELKQALKKSTFAPTHSELYINFPKLAEGLTKILPEHLQPEVRALGEWGTQGYLRLQNQQALAWEGYTFNNPNENKGASFLHKQQGSPFTMASVIPHNAYLACAVGIENPQILASESKILQGIFKNLSGNMTLAYLTQEGKDEGSLLFLKATNPLGLFNSLQSFIRVAHKSALPATEKEQVGAYSLQEIAGWEHLRNALNIRSLAHFRQGYFALVGQYIVVANDRHVLKQYLQNYQDHKTWERLPTFAQIAPALKQASSFTLIAQMSLMWGRTYEWVSPKFQMLLSIYENEIKAMGWFVWQNVEKDEKLATRMQFYLDETTAKTVTEDTLKTDYTLRKQVNFGDLLYTQPYLMRNAETGETEILVQDFRKNVYLLNEKGVVLWKRNIGAQMKGLPTQVDIYGNNRLQYALSAGNTLYLIDRLGRNVSGFPVRMTDTTSVLQGVSVLDVQKNKDYWFAGCDERGRLFVLSRQVQWVAGWNPKRLAYRLGTPLQGIRIKDANYFIAVQENGQIHAFNAKGEPLAGFPLDTKQRFTATMHIESGNSLATTRVTTVSEDGKWIQFNMAGKLLKEEQLERPSGRAKFTLLQDEKRENYWFGITTESSWQILDRNGKKLMEDEINEGVGKWEIQLFEPLPNTFVWAITNKGEGKTSLYDMRGKMVGEPIASNAPIGLRYDKAKKQMIVYRVLGNKLAILAKNIVF